MQSDAEYYGLYEEAFKIWLIIPSYLFLTLFLMEIISVPTTDHPSTSLDIIVSQI